MNYWNIIEVYSNIIVANSKDHSHRLHRCLTSIQSNIARSYHWRHRQWQKLWLACSVSLLKNVDHQCLGAKMNHSGRCGKYPSPFLKPFRLEYPKGEMWLHHHPIPVSSPRSLSQVFGDTLAVSKCIYLPKLKKKNQTTCQHVHHSNSCPK